MILVALWVNSHFFVVIGILFFYLKRFPRTWFIYFLVALFAYFRLQFALAEPQYTLTDEVETYQATVLSIKKQSEERQTAIIEIDSHRVYLTYPNLEPLLLPGDRIQVEGQLRVPSNPTIPHQFNFKKYLRSQRVGLTLYGVELTRLDNQWSIWRYQYQLVHKLEAYYPPLTATYLKAFFLGIQQGISDELELAYQQLGIVHLFAISGLHVNLLTSLLRYILKRLGLIRNIIEFMVIGFLIIFIVIAGGSPSIVRAGMMTILGIFNRQLKWRLSSYDIFSIIFLVNFFLNPNQVYQIGFIYSYWITFVLISSQWFLKDISAFKKLFFIPFLAQVSALPIQLFHTYEFNLVSYLANLLMIPLVTSCLIPLLLLTLIIPPMATVTEVILSGFEFLNLWSASWLSYPVIFGAISESLVLLLMCLILSTSWYYERTRNRWTWFVLIFLFAVTLEGQRLFNPASQVTFLDVGQGDGMVIQSSYQQCTVIVDTGGQFSFTGESRSIFSHTLEPYLLGEGVRKIDYLILTHEDFDHIGEATRLLQRFPVKTLIIGEGEFTGLFKEIIEVARQEGTEIIRAKTGDILTCGNQTYTFLQPKAKGIDNNEDSLVMTLEINDLTVLLTGDIGFDVESDILNVYSLEQLDIYKVAHHGSKYSNSKAFLETLNPTYAIVSAGRNNIYGHPSQELIEILNDLQIPLLSTQDYGSIQIKQIRSGYHLYSYPLE